MYHKFLKINHTNPNDATQPTLLVMCCKIIGDRWHSGGILDIDHKHPYIYSAAVLYQLAMLTSSFHVYLCGSRHHHQ